MITYKQNHLPAKQATREKLAKCQLMAVLSHAPPPQHTHMHSKAHDQDSGKEKECERDRFKHRSSLDMTGLVLVQDLRQRLL